MADKKRRKREPLLASALRFTADSFASAMVYLAIWLFVLAQFTLGTYLIATGRPDDYVFWLGWLIVVSAVLNMPIGRSF